MHPNMVPLLKSKDSDTLYVTDTALTEFTCDAAGQSVGMSSSFSNPIGGGASSAMDVDFSVSRPFAMVDEITEASPAAEDGLQLGDQIVKFGNVERGENLLQQLAAEVQQKQGEAVSLVVMRQGALINLTVTPRTWSGRGLLGYILFFPFLFFNFINKSWHDLLMLHLSLQHLNNNFKNDFAS